MDLLVLGLLYTLDPAQPKARAALIRDGRFACVGEVAACQGMAAPEARRIDLGNGSAVPGLADAHGHVLGLALALEEVSCAGLPSAEACITRAAERARGLPPGAWVRGRGWDQNLWPDGAFPDEALLSAAIPDRPVLLERVDGHAAWVNAAALRAAGIGKDTPDPPGGRIHRRADGSPSGVLVDAAQQAVTRRIPAASPGERERLLLAGLRALAAVGLTAVHDAGVDPETLDAYGRLARAGRLPLRVYAMIDGMAPPAELRAQLERWRREREVGLLSVRAVKLYADGALGSRGAALLAPYADEPASSGLLLLAPEELRSRLALVAGAGFQPAVHAIGDRACREVLDAYAAIETGKADAGGLRAQRPRIEHLQILRPEDAPRLAATGAVASMQPTHATSDGPWAEKRLGHGTPAQRGAYAWRRVLEVGAPLAFGSDFPVESPDPRLGLAAAEQRFPAGATEPWMPEQRLTRLEALRAFTGGVAYAAFAEERRGMIRVGMDGDLTAFGGDALAVPAAALPDLPIRATVVGGRVEYQGGNR